MTIKIFFESHWNDAESKSALEPAWVETWTGVVKCEIRTIFLQFPQFDYVNEWKIKFFE